MREAYKNVFKRVELDAIETEASGGAFSEFSHEYQVITKDGEDEIIYCPGGDFSANVEVAKVKAGKQCDLGHGPLQQVKTIEVGNIFPLGTKFSDALGLKYKTESGAEKPVIMGCYGIGISRLMGAIVEVHNDENGIVWPKEVAPFDAHLIHVGDPESEAWVKDIYKKLKDNGIDTLWDDRPEVSAGQKFADADLIGVPVRLVISKKTGEGNVEWKKRDEKKTEVIKLDEAIERFKN
jgi:prolyl-tRNA synthetase